MNELSNFVSSVGFPIAIAVGSCYVLFKIINKLFQRLLDTCDTLTDTNRELVETNSTFVNSFNEMRKDISEVKDKVEIICKEVVKQ